MLIIRLQLLEPFMCNTKLLTFFNVTKFDPELMVLFVFKNMLRLNTFQHDGRSRTHIVVDFLQYIYKAIPAYRK